MRTIQKDTVGVFLYRLSSKDGTILDDGGDDPMTYLHGYGNIVPGLENVMEGCAAGEAFRVELAPKDGYGEYIDVEPQPVHRNEFGEQYFDLLHEGHPIPLKNGQGERIVYYVFKKEGDYAYLTPNHPLAGQTLVFDIQIVRVREALPEEMEQGLPL